MRQTNAVYEFDVDFLIIYIYFKNDFVQQKPPTALVLLLQHNISVYNNHIHLAFCNIVYFFEFYLRNVIRGFIHFCVVPLDEAIFSRILVRGLY